MLSGTIASSISRLFIVGVVIAIIVIGVAAYAIISYTAGPPSTRRRGNHYAEAADHNHYNQEG